MSLTPAEAAAVLTRAALIDNRTFDADTARAWADVLDPDLTLDVALRAVAHHQATAVGVYLTPAHVNDYRKQLRAVELQRLRDAGPPDFPSVKDRDLTQLEHRQYRELWQEQIRRGATREQATVQVDTVLGYDPRRELTDRPIGKALEGMFSTGRAS